MKNIEKWNKKFFDYCFTCYAMENESENMNLSLEDEAKIKRLFVKLREEQPQKFSINDKGEYVFETDWDITTSVDSVRGLGHLVKEHAEGICILYSGFDIINHKAFVNFIKEQS